MVSCNSSGLELAPDGSIAPFTIEAWVKISTPANENNPAVIVAANIEDDDEKQAFWFGIEHGAPVFHYSYIPAWGDSDAGDPVGGSAIATTSSSSNAPLSEDDAPEPDSSMANFSQLR